MAVPFPARASDRRFVRFRHRNLSAIAVAHGGKRAENDLYVPHARFLMSVGVPVPRVLFDHPDRRAALLEDVGDCSLESMLPSLSRENRIAIYTAVLEAASLMHSAGTRAAVSRAVRLIDPFSPSLYMWEHELFLQRFLQPRVKPPPRVERAIMRELGEVSARLQKQPPVLVHRDLQSSNVHVRGRSVVLIDFQGMRMGAAIYDLASLLCDPYAMLPREDRERLLTVYAGLVGRPTGDIAALFPQAAVQRLVQALGAFGRMCEDRDTSRFSRYITPGLQMLEAMIRECGEMPALAAGVSQALESEQPGRKL
jgi:aminoglycoside/choline kinase family phosphotransferase